MWEQGVHRVLHQLISILPQGFKVIRGQMEERISQEEPWLGLRMLLRQWIRKLPFLSLCLVPSFLSYPSASLLSLLHGW